MESQRVNSGGDVPFSGLRTNSGQFSNKYVEKLMQEKLAQYELELQSIRAGNSNETTSSPSQNSGGTVAQSSYDSTTENKKILMEFTQLKIDNLKNLLSGMESKESGNIPPVV